MLNADDPYVRVQAERTKARVTTFGQKEKADVGAEHVRSLGANGFTFDLVAPHGRANVRVPGLAETTVINALAAAAAALAAGASLDDVVAGLALHRQPGGRMEPVRLPGDVLMIDDTYNANPQSMGVALRSLAELKGRSRGLAVLGDMAELGDDAARAHRATGRLVAELGIEHLFALGQHARETAAGATEAGMDPARICVLEDHAALGDAVSRLLQGGDWVLVKGSRSSHMERVVQSLTGDRTKP